jgi:hypothetical protein
VETRTQRLDFLFLFFFFFTASSHKVIDGPCKEKERKKRKLLALAHSFSYPAAVSSLIFVLLEMRQELL